MGGGGDDHNAGWTSWCLSAIGDPYIGPNLMAAENFLQLHFKMYSNRLDIRLDIYLYCIF